MYSRDISEEIQDYLRSTDDYSMMWDIKINKRIGLLEIHDKLCEEFKGIVTTTLSKLREVGKEEIELIKSLEEQIKEEEFLGFTVKGFLPDKKGKKVEIEFYENYLHFDTEEKILTYDVRYNVSTDYPRNRITGKLVDLTPYAKENRKIFNGILKFLVEYVNGEVVDTFPNHKEKYRTNSMKWVLEEIDKNGFKALSERKEEYERQQKSIFARIFGR